MKYREMALTTTTMGMLTISMVGISLVEDGRNMTTESLEQDREYYRLYPVYANVKDSSQVGNNGKAEYSYWLKIKAQHKKDSLQNALVVTFMPKMLKRLHSADSILHTQTHRDSNYVKDIDSVHISDSASRVILRDARALMVNNNVPPTMSIGAWVADGYRYLDDRKSRLKQESDDPNAERHEIVGDDPDNINDRNYGNNNIAAGAPLHGTHVAGIIAAIRGNGMGSDGITDNVLIMAVRAAPMGDEHDKDIALAIRYAVGNGARVINMSFGKFYSPGKKWVDEALQYAETKDVLLVHGAGNDGIDIDTAAFFPTPEYVNSHERAGNFITVGATQGGPDSLLVAGFSNFGAKEVDLFAPGFQIYSTVPGNKYEFESGTSMASPVVAGIAALIMEYYPALSARQVKYVLEESVMKIPDLKVKLPGSKTKVDFASMSKSQGIVNAYNALELAATLKGERKLTNGKQSSTHFVRQ